MIVMEVGVSSLKIGEAVSWEGVYLGGYDGDGFLLNFQFEHGI